jgi:GWxTD domain-containing protein
MFLLVGCSSTSASKVKISIDADPFYDSFFEKTRLIMSKEEINIYKHLPDKESKKEFVKDFWAKRDPTPDTEGNEIKEEFFTRIEYANKWFDEHRSKDKGWDTERGRILLQIGFPEERQWGELPDTGRSGRLMTTQPRPMEVWYYYRYQMRLIFLGDRQGFHTFRLPRPPAQLGTVLEIAKKALDLGTNKPKKDTFKFKGDFIKNDMVITIDTERISFAEKDGKMSAEFRIEMHVYRDYKKIETIVEEKSISKAKNELLNSKKVEFSITYTPPEKGEYNFDVIVMEKSSSVKYRTFLKKKF